MEARGVFYDTLWYAKVGVPVSTDDRSLVTVVLDIVKQGPLPGSITTRE